MIGWLESRLRGKVPETIPYTDPLHAGRHPFQTFMLVLVVVSSIPLVTGHVPAGSVEETLPWWAAMAWGVSLLLGAATALIGTYWRGSYDTALLLERAGLDFVGFAAVVYGCIILIVTHANTDTWVAVGLVVGFGASCLTRARDIARIFARANELNPPRIEVEDE